MTRRRGDAGDGNRVDLMAMEAELLAAGFVDIAGVDEAGRGPLAGPVAVGAVIMPPGLRVAGVNDSKQVAPDEREALFDEIAARATAWAVAFADVEEIDARNILQATKRAAARALRALTTLPDFVLLDALALPGLATPQRSVIGGDARCHAIAAASIMAKVSRDRLMTRLAAEFPGYGFDGHKGYGTAAHRAALAARGPSTVHRRSFVTAVFPAGHPGWDDPVWSVTGAALRTAQNAGVPPPPDLARTLSGLPAPERRALAGWER